MSLPLDELDRALIAQLQANARLPTADLARRLGVARTTVVARLARLEAGGAITGYTVRLRPDTMPDQITAWMSITVEGNRTREVVAMLLGEPGITGLFDTNGRWDLLAEIRSSSLQELADVLERVRLIKGIASTETSIHLQSYKLG